MDQYTSETQTWLNDRFKLTSKEGIYLAHQNIYGFKSDYCEDGIIFRYIIFSNIVKALSKIDFESFLDVGGAEGYMSAAVKHFFSSQVRSCDLSEEACKRAVEIFHIDADPVEGTSLPYDNCSYDVVLCSESLEHIPDYEKVLSELLRVARKAVVITVPHEKPAKIVKNIVNQIPHGHINSFQRDSFHSLIKNSYEIHFRGMYCPLLKPAFYLIEGRQIPTESTSAWMRYFLRIMNPIILIGGRCFNESSFKVLLAIDSILSNTINYYSQMIFIVVKNPHYFHDNEIIKISVDSILKFRVPLYYLNRDE